MKRFQGRIPLVNTFGKASLHPVDGTPNLLLDTCALIWLTSEPAQLSEAASTAINDPAAVLHISHASLWEITLKHCAGRLALPDSPRKW